MQSEPHCWAANFRAALTLLARTVTRLPFGVTEPVLVGLSALELYSGGAWPNGELELVTDQPRALRAVLMAEGFRWTDRPRNATLGLWHPELEISAEVVANALPGGADNPTATLTVELGTVPGTSSEPATLRVIGIEDLITECAVAWVVRGGSRRELAYQLQVLMELGRAGVGGPMWLDYLRRRLADATAGEVELDVSHATSMSGHGHARRITETQMLAALHAWRVRRGMSASWRGSPPRSIGRASPPGKIYGRHGGGRREGGLDIPAANVLAFEFPSHRQRR